MFDYTFRFIKDKKVAELKYQDLIKHLDIQDVIVEGQPLSAGGTPQAATVKGIFEKLAPGTAVEVYYDGRLIL